MGMAVPERAATGPPQPAHGIVNGKLVPHPMLGWFYGVYMPGVQSLLGVLLFLRLPLVLAEAGVVVATCIVLLCLATTFLTTLSLAALVTTGRLSSGGPYFIVTRTLGQSPGVALGLLFFVGTAFGCAVFIVGAAEALQTAVGLEDAFPGDTQAIAAGLVLVVACMVGNGIHNVNRAATVALAGMIIGLSSVVVGVVVLAAGGKPGYGSNRCFRAASRALRPRASLCVRPRADERPMRCAWLPSRIMAALVRTAGTLGAPGGPATATGTASPSCLRSCTPA